MAGASLQFQRILSPTMPVTLFKVILPLIYSKLSGTDIRNYRRVCTGWTKSVNAFLEAHPISRALEPFPYHSTKTYESIMTVAPRQLSPYQPQYIPSLFQKSFCAFIFEQSTEISSFIDTSGSHPRSPFILRFLDLSNDQMEDQGPELYWNQVNFMLSIFGHHLWRVHLERSVNDENRDAVMNCYEILRSALQYMPNLKILSIGGFECYRCHHVEDEIQLVLFESFIRSHTLPELPYLHTLDISIPGIFKTQSVTDELMKRYSSQLQKVYLLSSMCNMEHSYYQNLPNLTELQLGVNGSSVECIEILKNINAPVLGKLSLYFCNQTHIRRILKCLSSHLSNLTYLRLKFNKAPYLDLYRPDFSEVRIENIKTLEVFENKFVSYDLLLSHLPALEYILVCAGAEKKGACLDEGEFQIRTWMFSESIYSSNVWSKLPTLREFTFAWVEDDETHKQEDITGKIQYTREMHEYIIQKEKDGKSIQ